MLQVNVPGAHHNDVIFPGTTDNCCELSDNPKPSEKEIQFILGEIRNYLNPDVNGMLK